MAKTQKQEVIDTVKRMIAEVVNVLTKPTEGSKEHTLLLARVNEAVVSLEEAEKLLLSVNSMK
jgi:hypothetical protein